MLRYMVYNSHLATIIYSLNSFVELKPAQIVRLSALKSYTMIMTMMVMVIKFVTRTVSRRTRIGSII